MFNRYAKERSRYGRMAIACCRDVTCNVPTTKTPLGTTISLLGTLVADALALAEQQAKPTVWISPNLQRLEGVGF
jgi:hypothetical protein